MPQNVCVFNEKIYHIPYPSVDRNPEVFPSAKREMMSPMWRKLVVPISSPIVEEKFTQNYLKGKTAFQILSSVVLLPHRGNRKTDFAKFTLFFLYILLARCKACAYSDSKRSLKVTTWHFRRYGVKWLPRYTLPGLNALFRGLKECTTFLSLLLMRKS